MRQVLIAAAPIAFAVVVMVVTIRLRARVQRRLYPGIGLEEWRRAAAGVAWSDRWRVARANGGGRAVEPRLARYAIQRARVMLGANERNVRFGFVRWSFLVTGVLLGVALALGVVQMLTVGARPEDWASFAYLLAVFILWAAIVAFWRPLFRRQERRLRQSIFANTEVLGGTPETRDDEWCG